MIIITPDITIDESEIEEVFIRASGPGGQNVNKVSTAVQLRFNVAESSLPEEVKERLIQIAGKRVSSENILIIDARRFRTREKNRKDALDRLIELIRQALIKPRKRKKTKPSLAAKMRRLERKRRRSEKKRRRSFRPDSEDS